MIAQMSSHLIETMCLSQQTCRNNGSKRLWHVLEDLADVCEPYERRSVQRSGAMLLCGGQLRCHTAIPVRGEDVIRRMYRDRQRPRCRDLSAAYCATTAPLMLGFAPFCSKYRTMAVWPLYAAQYSA